MTKKPTPQLLVIDWQQAEQLMNGNLQATKKLLKQFLAELPKILITIQQSFHQQDFKNLLKETHKLYGACCYCSLPALKQAAKDLESALRKQQISAIEPLVIALEQQINLLLETAAKDKQLQT